MAAFFPLAWLLLLVIIPLEAWVAKRLLGLTFRRAMAVSTRANLVSALLGVPLAWALAAVSGVALAYFWAIAMIGRYLGSSIDQRSAPWTAAFITANVLLLPGFFISVGCEYLVARRLLEPHLRPRLHRWAWSANALSYAMLLTLLTGLFRVFPFDSGTKILEVGCITNLRTIGAAILLYQKEHRNRMPPTKSFAELAQLLEPELPRVLPPPGRWELPRRPDDIFRCPDTHQAYLFNADVARVTGASIPEPDETAMVMDAAPHTGGGLCVLFADGHVRRFRAADQKEWPGHFK